MTWLLDVGSLSYVGSFFYRGQISAGVGPAQLQLGERDFPVVSGATRTFPRCGVWVLPGGLRVMAARLVPGEAECWLGEVAGSLVAASVGLGGRGFGVGGTDGREWAISSCFT